MTDPLRYLALSGSLGCGFEERSLERGVDAGLAFIACDSGSTDGGPYYLGSDAWIWADSAYERDLRLGLAGARRAGVPLIVGSCGGGGGDRAVAGYLEMVDRLAAELGWSPTVACVFCEPDREVLAAKYDGGRLVELPGAPAIDRGTFSADGHIVAMAGAEQVQWALDTGADVVLMGRVADAALYAAIPLAAGHDPALVWNAAKIMECGAAAALNRRGQDSLLCTLDADGFVLEAPDPDLVCTPASVAAHTLYEVSDPYRLVMPSGVLDSREARYEALDDRRVRVTGGRWTPSEQYTVKLEGSAPLGFLSSFWGSISDPLLLGQLDAWCASVEDRLRVRLGEVGAGSFEVAVRTYGAGATTAQHGAVPREAVLVVDVVGQTQDAASAMARAAYHVALHWPIQGWSGGSVTSFAHPYSAPVVDRGPVYRFTLNHAAVLGDDEITGLFRLETHRVGAA
ncbi:acyclic terpene utilization AtuA family protein [Rhabdothermincola salaria]|uniref:acyclic terpene utilization AtuA family protein n=1 Tax=Rhabdothermincola salaria TaxID=2903142 RepID=UPI001E526805|nr:DUF1446 domain-containing protein [Rhabdothermincola salaria]